MNSRQTEDGGGGRVTKPVDDSPEAEQLTADLKVTSIRELSEVVGKLIAVNRNGVAVIEARRRFEIPVEGAPSSLRSAVGKVVGVMIIDGQVRWRLVNVSTNRGPGDNGPNP
ncbi:MAG: hypothetical protein LYZ69_07930 [Nitrososphaerales archaeon]|nr:hypothetical protein [Nitrososphaerales archaeon]